MKAALPDTPRRSQHERNHGRLDAIQDASHHGYITKGQISPRERNQNQERRQHEQATSDDAAGSAVHEPADIGGELHCLGPGQQHAVVQRMKKTLLGDPALFFDQLIMHQGDLTARTTKANKTKTKPVADCFG